ncbi:DUF1800 domain-containing protein [Nocardioides sp. Bht2]|uniref:DUF1800 domain-containing protein n=1 Tax=Nocardioides sp. Bht2 TaxID=3392297 RepID=UPI0039B56919
MPIAALPSSRERHVANRFSYGWTPELSRQIKKAGGSRDWFTKQLKASRIDDSFQSRSFAWWPSLRMTPQQMWAAQQSGEMGMWEVMEDYRRWCLVRRVQAKPQLWEMVAETWENHLHVPAIGEAEAPYRVAYGRGIRQRALGRYADLLNFAITHPAMGAYLSNLNSTASSPSEDLGRELLELHTVGRGVFTENDVKNSARILTGYTGDLWNTWKVGYRPANHYRGTVKVLGFKHKNTASDGRPVVRAYLNYLARHPATARRVARVLAVRFVSDSPPASLITKLAKVYRANDTAIRPVLKALFESKAFAAAIDRKVRTPEEDVVATYRALGYRISASTGQDSAARSIVWQAADIGLAPFTWPRPDGRPDQGAAWASTSRMLASFDVHYTMAGGWWPSKGFTRPVGTAWLPASRVRFDQLVEHLSRTLTGRRAPSWLVTACGQAVKCAPNEMIDANHPMVRWYLPRLLTTVLDQPAHMTR